MNSIFLRFIANITSVPLANARFCDFVSFLRIVYDFSLWYFSRLYVVCDNTQSHNYDSLNFLVAPENKANTMKFRRSKLITFTHPQKYSKKNVQNYPFYRKIWMLFFRMFFSNQKIYKFSILRIILFLSFIIKI